MSADVLRAAWRWPNFTPEEMACKGTGAHLIVPEFMDRLQALRTAWGRPMAITSAYRTPDYNARVSTTGRTGPHTTGRAVDVLVRGIDALDLAVLAKVHGFTGFGFQQAGPVRFLHLDDLAQAPGRPRPHIWSY